MSAGMNASPSHDPFPLVRRLTGFARSLGMSAMLTMRLFDAQPEREPRDRAAIVRHIQLSEGFDPREILPNGVVLTVPYSVEPGVPVANGERFFLN
jgi:hypothetical protein